MIEDAVSKLARFIVEDPFEIDSNTLSTIRLGIIDTLGCIYAGAQADVSEKSRAAVAAMGVKGSSEALGADLRTTRPHAAFLNAVAAHALDFDDWEIPGNTHPTAVLFPSLLAVAENPISGHQFAQAYLAGFEVIARLGEGLNFEHYDAGWHSTATLGAPAAAAACARLLDLTVEETANAISIAVSAASGYTCQFGSEAKPIQAGFAARTGVEAVYLARAGISGKSSVIDHSRGMAALMGGLNRERLTSALHKLGNGYALSEHGLVLKPWPSCGYTHRIMTCAIRLKEKISPEEIKSIDLHLPDFHAAVVPFTHPRNRSEALFSLPFVAAMGLLKGQLTLSDIQACAWEQGTISKLIGKTSVHPFEPLRPDMNYSDKDPDRMVVKLLDGQVLEEKCTYPLGAPQEPMSDAQIWAKFETNIGPFTEAHASKHLWSARLREWPSESCI
ncbi:MAG: MmgE/PrpD family protein, partial [Pseudomonadota bacterium]